MEKFIADETYTAFLLPGIKAIVTTEPPKRYTSSPIKEEGSSKMALWGDDNDFPQKVIEDVRKDPEIGTLLDKQARLLYSGGLVYGRIEILEGGKEVLKAASPEERKMIDDWLRKSNINRYVYEAARDLYWFYNVYPELVLSLDRTKIAQLCVQPAEICRWEKMDKTGVVKTCFINANFPDETETSERTKKVPVLDPYYDPASTLRTISSGYNFIYPLSIPTPGSSYYQLADWNSIRESGWLAVSQAIPKFKAKLLDNQLSIKYHVEISNQYWPLKYPDYDKKSPAEKRQIMDAELKKFNDILSGVEKAGNSIVTAMMTDKTLGKEYSLWKINVIDDKVKDGKYLEDGKDASLYKMSSIGLHPALIGTMPNNGMGGAGSNIREAYNLHMLSVRAHQDILLEPLDVVKNYNGWPEDIVFRFRNSFMNTLDAGNETSQTRA